VMCSEPFAVYSTDSNALELLRAIVFVDIIVDEGRASFVSAMIWSLVSGLVFMFSGVRASEERT
jgi:hypothetical protein